MTQRSSALVPLVKGGRSFLVFWYGQTISTTGSAMAGLALPLLVLQATGSLLSMGLISALLATGSLLAGAVAGGIADRFDRRLVLLGSDALSALCFGVIPLIWWLVGPQMLALYLLSVPIGFLAIASSIAATASLPRLVEPDRLTEAMSRYQASNAIAQLAGPILAGVLLSVIATPLLFGINALSYLASVASLLLIRLQSNLPAATLAPSPRGSFLAGARWLVRDQLLCATVLLRLGTLALIGGGLDLITFRIRHELHQTTWIVGIVWGSSAFGALLAGVLTPALRRRLGFSMSLLGGFGLMGVSGVLIGLNPTVGFLVVLGVTLAFGDIVAQIVSMSLLQEQTPDALLGRVTAAFQTGQWGGTALGAIASTAVAAWLGSTVPVFIGIGVLILAQALLGLLTPARFSPPQISHADTAD